MTSVPGSMHTLQASTSLPTQQGRIGQTTGLCCAWHTTSLQGKCPGNAYCQDLGNKESLAPAWVLGPDQNCPTHPLTIDFSLGTIHLLPRIPPWHHAWLAGLKSGTAGLWNRQCTCVWAQLLNEGPGHSPGLTHSLTHSVSSPHAHQLAHSQAPLLTARQAFRLSSRRSHGIQGQARAHVPYKGLTPLAPHTGPSLHAVSASPQIPFPRRARPFNLANQLNKRKPGMAKPSAPNMWRPSTPFSPSPGAPLCPLRSLLSLPPAPTCFLSAPGPSLPSVTIPGPPPPPHGARSLASPAFLTYGQGRRCTTTTKPRGSAGACASRSPRLHDNPVLCAGSPACPAGLPPISPPPRLRGRLLRSRDPARREPAPRRLRGGAVLLEGRSEDRPSPPPPAPPRLPLSRLEDCGESVALSTAVLLSVVGSASGSAAILSRDCAEGERL